MDWMLIFGISGIIVGVILIFIAIWIGIRGFLEKPVAEDIAKGAIPQKRKRKRKRKKKI